MSSHPYDFVKEPEKGIYSSAPVEFTVFLRDVKKTDLSELSLYLEQTLNEKLIALGYLGNYATGQWQIDYREERHF